MSVPQRGQRLSSAISDETGLPALGTANDLPEPRHVEVFRPILGDSARAGWSAGLRRLPRRGLRRAVAVLVLISALTVLAVIAHERILAP